MSRRHISGSNHTKEQMNHHANQMNPNNAAHVDCQVKLTQFYV